MTEDELRILNDGLLDRNHVCSLCIDPNPKIKELYFKWVKLERIAVYAEIINPQEPDRLKALEDAAEKVREHAEAWGWDLDRPRDTANLYDALIREAGPGILKAGSGKGGTPAKVIALVARQKDNIKEREKEREDPNGEMLERSVLMIMQKATQLMKEGMDMKEILEIFDSTMPGLTDLVRQRMGISKQTINITPGNTEDIE